MQLRRRRFKTADLRAAVHPVLLNEVLKNLKLLGEIEWYQIWRFTTIIKLTKGVGLNILIKEASQPVATTRPNIKNKTNERTLRKTKS
jgi:hypothetical protein